MVMMIVMMIVIMLIVIMMIVISGCAIDYNDDCDNVVSVHHALTTPSVTILENPQGQELSAAAAPASASFSATSYTSLCMLHGGGTLRTPLSMHQAQPEGMRSFLVL